MCHTCMQHTWNLTPTWRELRSARVLVLMLVLAPLLVAACATDPDAPPRLVVDQSVCAECSMLISEPAFAAAYRIDGREHLFDDLGCLLEALAAEAAPEEARVWVHDFESRSWIDAGEATFVRASGLHTPMGSGLAALADPAAARTLADEADGRLVPDFGQLLREGRHAD